MSVEVQICRGCREQYFPPRLRCARCGGRSFDRHRVAGGAVEQTTILQHRAGLEGSLDIALGVVRTDDGLRLLARLNGPTELGTRVLLEATESGGLREPPSDRLFGRRHE